MVKILFMIPTLGQGGAEKVLINLVNNMNRELFEISVMALFDCGENKKFLKKDIHYKYIFKKIFRGNSHILKLFSPEFLYKKMIKEKYDIVVSYLEGPTARIVSGNTDGTKLVSWIHCTMHNNKDFSVGFRNINEARKSYQKFDQCIFVSDDVKKHFLEQCRCVHKTKVLYNVVDSDFIINKSYEKINNEIFNKRKGITLIAVGKIIPIKGFDRLARIHKKLIDQDYHIQTYILGTGKQMKKIKKYIDEVGIADSFHFLGYHINPYKYVRNSDLFICSSLSEGFSTAITESLIVGTPVISTDVSGVKDLLGDNEYGIVTCNTETDLYKAIKCMLDHPEKLQYYKEQAYLRSASFQKDTTVQEIENMLLNLLEEK
ncbi:MAG: glycosyltransferase [Massilimicrobiota timonensis]